MKTNIIWKYNLDTFAYENVNTKMVDYLNDNLFESKKWVL